VLWINQYHDDERPHYPSSSFFSLLPPLSQALQAKVYSILDQHDSEFDHYEEDGRRYALQTLHTEIAWCYAK